MVDASMPPPRTSLLFHWLHVSLLGAAVPPSLARGTYRYSALKTNKIDRRSSPTLHYFSPSPHSLGRIPKSMLARSSFGTVIRRPSPKFHRLSCASATGTPAARRSPYDVLPPRTISRHTDTRYPKFDIRYDTITIIRKYRSILSRRWRRGHITLHNAPDGLVLGGFRLPSKGVPDCCGR